MFLNMDRNTLWGAAGGMVFEHEKSWDALDRFEWVEKTANEQQQAAARALARPGRHIGLFNPLNWKRSDPVVLRLPEGTSMEGPSQAMPDGAVLCRPELAGLALTPIRRAAAARVPQPVAVPQEIETNFYRARIDSSTGALVSLKVKPSGREALGGAANRIVLERPDTQYDDTGNQMLPRSRRRALAASDDTPVKISAVSGPLATVVTVEGELKGAGPCRRTILFYNDHPRIDFETEFHDLPDRTVLVAEFGVHDAIAEVRRGIPYGFSHGAWEKQDASLHGWTKSITPAVRWSHYQFQGGGGMALFDRGLTGRELVGRTPLLFLFNATDKYYGYPNSWLAGKGKHVVSYALTCHEANWRSARIPQMAWEYCSEPVVVPGISAPAAAQSFLDTSDNVIVECLRRDSDSIEIRLVECFGQRGTATLRARLPHKEASRTDMLGANAKPLPGGPAYSFPVRPQQIVTIRLRTSSAVEIPKPLVQWDELVPEHKRGALHEYSNDKGLPPRGE